MNFLVIGCDFESLFLGKHVSEYGWPVSFLAKQKFEYKPDSALVNPQQFNSLGFDYTKGLMTQIETMEIIDLAGNKREARTNSVLINLSVYKNEMYKELAKKSKFYEDSKFIDKNNDNIFIQKGEHGLLIKSKFVLDLEDVSHSTTSDKGPECKLGIKATVERFGTRGKLTLKFFDKGYVWIVNYTPNTAEMFLVSDNPEEDFENFVKENKLKIVYKKNVGIPLYKKDRLLENHGVYLSGPAGLITNNLSFYNIILRLKYALLTAEFAHTLMTKKMVSFIYLSKEFDEQLIDIAKKAKLFWGLKPEKKNQFIARMDFRDFCLDFETAFTNLSRISPYRLKLYFS